MSSRLKIKEVPVPARLGFCMLLIAGGIVGGTTELTAMTAIKYLWALSALIAIPTAGLYWYLFRGLLLPRERPKMIAIILAMDAAIIVPMWATWLIKAEIFAK
jgi:hypothetical protein